MKNVFGTKKFLVLLQKFVTSRGICQSVGENQRKGECLPIIRKKGCVQKIQPGLHHSHNGLYIDLYFVLGDNTRGEKKKRDAAFDQLTF